MTAIAAVAPIALLATLDTWDSLEPGDQVLVRFGSFGSQTAVITHRTRTGYLMGRKWQARGRRYTKPVRIHPTDILNIITRKADQ